jgi:acylphosphatase
VNASNEASQRREVVYSGRVQGVGFRYTVRAIAARFDVTGFVRNLADGRVHLVAEGTPAVLDGILAAIADEMERYIERAETTTRPASGEFADLQIRH